MLLSMYEKIRQKQSLLFTVYWNFHIYSKSWHTIFDLNTCCTDLLYLYIQHRTHPDFQYSPINHMPVETLMQTERIYFLRLFWLVLENVWTQPLKDRQSNQFNVRFNSPEGTCATWLFSLPSHSAMPRPGGKGVAPNTVWKESRPKIKKNT